MERHSLPKETIHLEVSYLQIALNVRNCKSCKKRKIHLRAVMEIYHFAAINFFDDENVWEYSKGNFVTFIRDSYNRVCTIQTLPPLRCASSRWIIMISDNKIFCIFNGCCVAFALWIRRQCWTNNHERRSVVDSAFHLLSRRVYTSRCTSLRRFHETQ